MSNTVEKLMQNNRVVHTIEHDGEEYDFLCHKWSLSMAIEAFGAGAFTIVNDEDRTRVEIDAKAVGERNDLVEKVLRVVMIDPRLGDEDDAGKSVVSMRTLNDTAWPLYQKVMGQEQTDAANFPESPEDRKE